MLTLDIKCSQKCLIWYRYNVWVKSKDAHAPLFPPPPPPGWPLGIWHFLFFLVKFTIMQAVSLVKCPPPWAKLTNQESWTRFSTLPFLLFFVHHFNIYVHHFVFCVHSDHLGSRYELSAFGTLQSSVSRQEEVQEHESVHSKFCNSRVFSEGSLPSGFNYWQRSKSFIKCT